MHQHLTFGEEIESDGSVKIVKATSNNRHVFVTILTDSYVKEGEMMRQLRHRNVTTYLESFYNKDHHLSFLFDGHLKNILFNILHRTNDPLDSGDVLKWIRDIAEGLQYLHHDYNADIPIMHRDLKSFNIYIKTDDTAMIGDFEQARRFTQDSHLSLLGGSTGQWLPPEAINGELVSLAADIWSYGIIVWELITRKKPFFFCEEYGTIVLKIGRYHHPTVPKECPSVLQKILITCFKAAPSQRKSMKAIVRHLSTELAGEKGSEVKRKLEIFWRNENNWIDSISRWPDTGTDSVARAPVTPRSPEMIVLEVKDAEKELKRAFRKALMDIGDRLTGNNLESTFRLYLKDHVPRGRLERATPILKLFELLEMRELVTPFDIEFLEKILAMEMHREDIAWYLQNYRAVYIDHETPPVQPRIPANAAPGQIQNLVGSINQKGGSSLSTSTPPGTPSQHVSKRFHDEFEYISKRICEKWDMLARKLDIASHIVAAIKERNSTDEKRAYRALIYWEKKHPNEGITAINEALKQCGLHGLANRYS